MKKIFLTAMVVLSMVVLSQAQVKWGITAGANLSNQHSNTASATKLLSKDAYRGFHAGFVAEMPVFKNVYLQPQVLYTQTGAKYTSNAAVTQTKLSIKNISAPVNIIYKMPVSFGKIIAGAGPVISYGFSGKTEQNGQTKKLYSGDMKDWRRIDIAANALAGVEFNNGFFATVNYQMSLRDMNKSAAANVKNRSVSLSVGYLIDWNKLKRKA